MTKEFDELQLERERHRTTWRQLEQVKGLLWDVVYVFEGNHPAPGLVIARVRNTLSQQTEQAQAQDELLPCPFCGGEPNLTHGDYVRDDLSPMPVVECKSCSAWVRVEDWNRRATRPAQTEQQPVRLPERKRTEHLPKEYKTMTVVRAGLEAYNRALDDVAALNAAPIAQTTPLDADTLAEIIRKVDGNHSLGAGVLAERIVAELSSTPSPAKRGDA